MEKPPPNLAALILSLEILAKQLDSAKETIARVQDEIAKISDRLDGTKIDDIFVGSGINPAVAKKIIRVINRDLKINTVEGLIRNHSRTSLLKRPHLGEKTVRYLEEALARHNFTIRP